MIAGLRAAPFDLLLDMIAQCRADHLDLGTQRRIAGDELEFEQARAPYGERAVRRFGHAEIFGQEIEGDAPHQRIDHLDPAIGGRHDRLGPRLDIGRQPGQVLPLHGLA